MKKPTYELPAISALNYFKIHKAFNDLKTRITKLEAANIALIRTRKAGQVDNDLNIGQKRTRRDSKRTRKIRVPPVPDNSPQDEYASPSTYYRHLQQFIRDSLDFSEWNLAKAKSLSLGYAKAMGALKPTNEGQDKAIVDGISSFLQMLMSSTDTATSRGRKGGGRSTNFEMATTDVIDDICAAAMEQARAQGLKGVNANVLGKRLGRKPDRIRAAAQRLKRARATQSMKDTLLRFRGNVRGDKLDEEWEEHASKFWMDHKVSRESEISRRTMRNPHSRKDPIKYRHRYLTISVGKAHALMVQEGCNKYPGFHLSLTRFSELRPFFVKDSCRESCLCVYHLCMQDAARVLYNYRQGLRSGSCKCNTEDHPLCRDTPDLWHYLLCPRPEGHRVYARHCVNNTCKDCKGAKRLDELLCRCVDPNDIVKWTKYESVDTNKTKVNKETGEVEKVFRSMFADQGEGQGTKLSEFLDYFKAELWPQFIAHHDLAVWEDYSWQQQKANMPPGHVVTVEDYPENMTHEDKNEPQSAYWSHLQSGMYVLCARFQLDDLTDIDDDEREELRSVFEKNNLPPIVTQSHIFISPDTHHGVEMVQHANGVFNKYLEDNAPSVHTRWARSDGCRSQYKGKNHFGL